MGRNGITAVLVVAFGGAIDSALSYSVYRVVDSEFPWATFIVNFIGCTLAAFLLFKFETDMGDSLKTCYSSDSSVPSPRCLHSA